MTSLISHFITTQSILTEWKSSIISPVHKKGSKSEKSIFRFVSILTTFSKVFENAIFDQMYAKIAPLLSQNLSGLLKSHSYSIATLKMTED